jgi:hypothetical protein
MESKTNKQCIQLHRARKTYWQLYNKSKYNPDFGNDIQSHNKKQSVGIHWRISGFKAKKKQGRL